MKLEYVPEVYAPQDLKTPIVEAGLFQKVVAGITRIARNISPTNSNKRLPAFIFALENFWKASPVKEQDYLLETARRRELRLRSAKMLVEKHV